MRLKVIKESLSDYVKSGSDLYEFLSSINSAEIRTSDGKLYEARNNTEYIVNHAVDKLLKTGKINLNGYKLGRDEDIFAIAKLLGNRMFETSRILYVKNGKIIGSDNFTIDHPGMSPVWDKEDEIAFYRIDQKTERLNADGYYLVHNHPSGNSEASFYDIKVCNLLKQKTNKFLGGIVLGKDNISTITGDDYDSVDKGDYTPETEYVNYPAVKKFISDLDKEKDCSYVIYADSQFRLIAVQKIGNSEFKDKNIYNYINNEKHNNGARFCYLYTDDFDIYYDSCKKVGDSSLFIDTMTQELDGSIRTARSSSDYMGRLVVDEIPDKRLKKAKRL